MRFSFFRRSHKFLRYLGAIALSLLLVLVMEWGRSPALADQPRHYTDLELPPLPEVRLPDYTRFELDNGLLVYLVEDHEFPLVGGRVMIRTGDRFDPPGKTGLATITGNVMRTGGTRSHPTEDLNRILEQRAASVEVGIDTTVGSASFDSLSEDLEEVFDLFVEVLREPALPEARIDFVKNQIRGGIERRNDDPEDIANREFQKLIYGKTSPYAQSVEYTTLNAITREDVVQFYNRYVHPNNMILGIVGDFDSQQMRSLIAAKLGDWRPNPAIETAEFASLPAVSQAQSNGTFLVNQPQLTQSYIQMGHLGGKLSDPDYAALSVLNEVMNGFGGRLVNEVRSRQGLAYVVYAYWSPRFDFPGVFVGGGQTRSEATVPFIRSMLAEVQKVRTIPITQEELTRAKDAVLNAFIFNFQTREQVLSRLMRYEYYGYPSDFIFRYRDAVERTTANGILRAAQTYLKPDNLVTLVVGNAGDMNPALDTIAPQGKVTPVDITIPQVGK